MSSYRRRKVFAIDLEATDWVNDTWLLVDEQNKVVVEVAWALLDVPSNTTPFCAWVQTLDLSWAIYGD